MKVFISWSGDESKQIAQALRTWLPDMFESVGPYMSDRDNEAGTRWSQVIADQLEGSDFGILCCTSSNLSAPWLNFEAGALSKAVEAAHVVPLLHGLKPSDISPPFSDFMAKTDDEPGLWDVVKAINSGLVRPREETALRRVFTRSWPDLRANLLEVSPSGGRSKPQRSDRELVEEILQLMRSQVRNDQVDHDYLRSIGRSWELL